LDPPHRDWRDYFIAATVFSGAGYALYWTAKRYIFPLISPPTPAQLEQDKSSVDASFDKAFALLDQLATDTQELKSAEAARKEKLDAALGEVEGVVGRMKSANEDRELESKRIAREIGEIRDSIPKALEKEKAATEERLKELVAEVKSLKTLVANRMQGGGAPPARSTPSFSSSRPATDAPTVNGTGAAASAMENGTSETNGSAAQPTPSPYTAPVYNSQTPGSGGMPTAARELPSRDGAGTPYSRLLGGKAAIPSWQLAAKKKSDDAKAAEAGSAATNGQNVQESGTVTESSDAAA
jgi:peroxin-14